MSRKPGLGDKWFISIHALREEGDTGTAEKPAPYEDFYPRPPRGGRQNYYELRDYIDEISIHALREEGDMQKKGDSRCQQHFYPRPPRGGRLRRSGLLPRLPEFLSTPSARRATFFAVLKWHRKLISIHALREEGDRLPFPGAEHQRISIHALREEGDNASINKVLAGFNFYPRPPRGGRLSAVRLRMVVLVISIHALREEGDDISRSDARKIIQFLSTPSARRAT